MFRYSNCYSAWLVLRSCKNCRMRLSSSLPPPTNLFSNKSITEQTQEKFPLQNLQKSSSGTEAALEEKNMKISTVTRNKLVNAAFSSLNTKKPRNLMDKLQAASTVNDLLSVTEVPQFTQYHALQALSILTNWTTENKVTMSDFEDDPRFVSLCKKLGRRRDDGIDANSEGEDLALILGITGGDQAAKLVSNITFPQKLKVLSSLAFKKRRTVPLLRALASSIGNSSEKLNVKEAADILYAMSVLNFPDDVLLGKAASDICLCLKDNKRPAVIGSILTSIGILKYKNEVLLNALSEWVQTYMPYCREQDLVALLLTLASVNHHPENTPEIYQMVIPVLSNVGLKPQEWLDVVWSLTVLNKAEAEHVQSVLNPSFIQKFHSSSDNCIPAPIKMKLLNINAAAQLIIKGYSGPLLTDSKTTTTFPLQRSREKQLLVDSVLDTLSNLFSSSAYLNTNVDTDYGFLIDGVCAVDHKCNPLPIISTSNDRKRVAVYVCDYHDMCRKSKEVSGPVALHLQILKHLGYNVMTVTYLDFNPSEKLIKRVKYLEKRLKDIAKENT